MNQPLIDQLRPSPQPAAAGFALWNLGFRPFYLLASAFSAFSVLAWAAQYTLAVVAGFLLTAVRAWTGQPALVGAPLMALAALWVAGPR